MRSTFTGLVGSFGRCLPLAAGLWTVGCNIPPPKQVHEVDREDRAETNEPEPPAPEPVATPAPPKPKKPPVDDPGSDDYELNLRDCDALARAYSTSWLNDEKAVLDGKGLTNADHEKVFAQIREDAKGMYDNYYDQCRETVGTVYLRNRLQCATEAKSMKRFDDCLEGRADE